MYQILFKSSAKKDIKKLDISVMGHIEEALILISSNPLAGENLKGDMRDYYSYHLKIKNVQYRIIYTIRNQELVVIVVLIGTRENIYKQLGKRI